jgi:hypothetical protein
MFIGERMGCSDDIHIIGFAIAPGTEVTVTNQSIGFDSLKILGGYIYEQFPVFIGTYPGNILFGCYHHIISEIPSLALIWIKHIEKQDKKQEHVFHLIILLLFFNPNGLLRLLALI